VANVEQFPETPGMESIFLPGGDIAVLLLHGFTGSPLSIAPWAHALHSQGFTVSAPRLAGHGTHWRDLNHTTWVDWYADVEKAFLQLTAQYERVFVAGFSAGGALALRLAQIRSSEMEGLILLNASIYDERKIFWLLPVLARIIPSLPARTSDLSLPNPPKHGYDRLPLRALNSLRQLWSTVEENLYLVDLPVLVAYSLNDHVVNPLCSETIMDNISSENIRELVLEESFHNVALDREAGILFDVSADFIRDVLTGDFSQGPDFDERDLINAEFESIVAGLSLDQSTPNTYLDHLDHLEREDSDGFIPPHPSLNPLSRWGRWTLVGVIAGPLYMLGVLTTGIDPLGLGGWPGLIAFGAGAIGIARRLIRSDDDFDDGAIL
jgi:carboxylesterase